MDATRGRARWQRPAAPGAAFRQPGPLLLCATGASAEVADGPRAPLPTTYGAQRRRDDDQTIASRMPAAHSNRCTCVHHNAARDRRRGLSVDMERRERGACDRGQGQDGGRACVRDLTTGHPAAMPGAARGRHRAPINGQPARGDPGRSDTPAPALCCGAPADCLGKFCPDGHETWRVHSKRSQKAPPSGTTPAPASKAERRTCSESCKSAADETYVHDLHFPQAPTSPRGNRSPRSNFWCTGGKEPLQMSLVKNNPQPSNVSDTQRSRSHGHPCARVCVDAQNPNILPNIDRADRPTCRGVRALYYWRSGSPSEAAVGLLRCVSSPTDMGWGRVECVRVEFQARGEVFVVEFV